jgi:DNA-binding beta-propeller fold protein YncE
MLCATSGGTHKLLIYNIRTQSVTSVDVHGALAGQLNAPSGVAVDNYGHVIVADSGNCRLQVFDVYGNFVRLINYPLILRDTAASSASGRVRVRIAVHNNHIYLLDSRMANVLWRLKY